MPGVTDAPSPGGWLNLLNSRIARWLVIGAVALTGGKGVLAVYGLFNGAQAAWYCEANLASATTDTVTYSCLNPLPAGITGAILATQDSTIFVNEAPAPATRLNIGTAASATTAIKGTAALANVASGITLNVSKKLYTLANTGALTADGPHGVSPVVLAPRDDTHGKRYLNFTFTRGGSGATVSGEAPVTVRIKIVPCNKDGVGC